MPIKIQPMKWKQNNQQHSNAKNELSRKPRILSAKNTVYFFHCFDMDNNDRCEKVRSINNGMIPKCSQKCFQAAKIFIYFVAG